MAYYKWVRPCQGGERMWNAGRINIYFPPQMKSCREGGTGHILSHFSALQEGLFFQKKKKKKIHYAIEALALPGISPTYLTSFAIYEGCPGNVHPPREICLVDKTGYTLCTCFNCLRYSGNNTCRPLKYIRA